MASSVVVLLEPTIECCLADLQNLGRFGSIPIGQFQDPLYVVPFNLSKGAIWGGRLPSRRKRAGDFRGNMLWKDHLTTAEHCGMFDGVLQLPDITWP